ncbi:hypothetical protein N7492_010079 [Penicillium capsulatum]|uniref:Asteroid domain-containing protein n=1 Tax=Penicillium capsulatum TaxID=69766 RepID=A0A9W9HQH4_9EURO|nr:hypothetical protein N7492_010079 [Penicillium capsulatum]KAJ6112587.1 hypothetical protein N7512_007911 [Penicillium capsulatum]
MGITYLTKHLLPYADTVKLGHGKADGLPRIRSIVIDGPSLVYHVYYRLLAWTDTSIDVLDIQPTCDEVSRGFVSFLLGLGQRGVEITNICFDGALPMVKRDIRLARIEKSRQRLELCRRRSHFSSQSEYRTETVIQPAQLWQSRHLPARWRNMPENIFMVSAVFEDLQHRWNHERILRDFQQNARFLTGTSEFPWAAMTTMTQGEADLECARVSRLTGSAVLTDDSDLVVHDLGPHGAVIMLNSMQLLDDPENLIDSEIRGLRLHPKQICRQLGIENIQLFAYNLKQNPRLGVPELLRRTKEGLGAGEISISYDTFLEEYQHPTPELGISANHQSLDPRVSELVWQYQRPDLYCDAEAPHMYLGILHEDPSRRCAWEQGRALRALAYSLLGLSQLAARRLPVVNEFVRRGGRIVAEHITLAGATTISSDMTTLRNRLDQAQLVFETDVQPSFWILFALSEIYRDNSSNTTNPSAVQLQRFLWCGFMGKTTEWADIHLMAQIQAVLYSLRVLWQLVLITTDIDTSALRLSTLAELPPLYILVGSRHAMTRAFSEELARQSVQKLFRAYN